VLVPAALAVLAPRPPAAARITTANHTITWRVPNLGIRHESTNEDIIVVKDPDTRAHGANESLHQATFGRACLAEALLLHRLGGISRD
jgi:hypothetical protein